MKKTLGIIGGMGPLATADFFAKAVMNTRAYSDKEHPRILIDCNTDIPDRTAAILWQGESPLSKILGSAQSLISMGAEILAMPCNTAHYYHREVQRQIKVPLLNMIELTRDTLIASGVCRAALLATRGTVQGGVYQNAFLNSGIDLILPERWGESAVSELIYAGVKSGRVDYDVSAVCRVMDSLLSSGAEIIILGCTELPVAFRACSLAYPCCDPTLILARAAIRAAGFECVDTPPLDFGGVLY